MVEIETMAELADFAGEDLGVSDWMMIDQTFIDRFVEDTRDLNWYHVDADRAERKLLDGKTIAHGFPTLSLVPGLAKDIIGVRNHGRALNYGLDKVRFLAPVPAGSSVRLRMRVTAATEDDRGVLITRECVMELEGSTRSAMVAEMLSLVLRDR